ncbi:TPA: hypothetical protein IAA68_07715 [Candidatus Galligastranaerophilus faecipullorum]|nr:hypothetical protein [Candidatus Galligastranaerophilus faecipullorum]
MKKLLTTFFVLLILCPFCAADEELLDMDMDIIDTPFGNRKAVTQEQFDRAYKEKSMPRKGLIQKFKDFLNRNEPENDPALKNFKSDGLGEMGMSASEIANAKPNVVLSGALIDSYGKIIPSGHYQIVFSDKDNGKTLSFMQGATLYGTLRAIDAKDNWEESNEIIYARIIYPSPDVARVIFSNIDVCVEGFARVANPE